MGPLVVSLYPAFLDRATTLARETALRGALDRGAPRALLPHDDDLAAAWPYGRLLMFAPTNRHPWRAWVSCGLSRPSLREADVTLSVEERFSGAGIELVLGTAPAEVSATHWAPALLLNVLRATIIQTGQNILPGDVISCGPLTAHSSLTHLVAIQCPQYPSRLILPGGHVAVVHLLGATAAEIERAKGLTPVALGQALFDRLGPITDPTRACLSAAPEFDAALSRFAAAAPQPKT